MTGTVQRNCNANMMLLWHSENKYGHYFGSSMNIYIYTYIQEELQITDASTNVHEGMFKSNLYCICGMLSITQTTLTHPSVHK